jgi:NAD(P)-dependent dehydrogenase (short-subunit alcohol dehydrogenase family)
MTARVILIVGASSGIGRASALRLAERGDHLVLASRSETALQSTAEACRAAGSESVDVFTVDVTQRDEVDKLVLQALDRHGRIDVVVHNATVMGYGRVEDMPAEVFTRVVDTAVHGTLYLAQAVLPVLRRQHAGVFIGVNSLLGSVTVPQMGAYATSKWGQLALLRTLQQETRDDPGVHVCIVSPGSINTPIYYQAANFTGREVRPPWPVLSPERVAATISALTDRPRQHVSVPVGPTNPVIVTGFRLLPVVYDRLVGPLFRLAATTRRALAPTDGNVHQAQPAQEGTHGHWPNRH